MLSSQSITLMWSTSSRGRTTVARIAASAGAASRQRVAAPMAIAWPSLASSPMAKKYTGAGPPQSRDLTEFSHAGGRGAHAPPPEVSWRMAGRVPQSFIDELIARTDIVELIGGRVQLKKAGREW